MKIVDLPRILIDLDDIPENFEEQIKEAFEKYTEGTADEYRFQDKLCFLDRCISAFHGEKDSHDAVIREIKNYFAYELEENGEFIGEDDVYCIEFMEDCYNAGKESQKMYSHDFGNRKEEEKVEKIIIRIIKALFSEEG